MTVTFCGHAQSVQVDSVKHWLKVAVQKAIDNGADTFYLGGYGVFDRMAAGVVREMKEKHPYIQSILVLAYLDRKIDDTGYDGTTYPPLESVPKRYAITHRNRWMVENADVIIAYVTHNWGGAAAMLSYAVRKKKPIIRYPD